MRRILPIMLVVLLIYPAGASVFFEIVDVPTIYVSPGGNSNFSVVVQNMGSESTYARINFRNIPDGMSIIGPLCTEWVDSGTTKEFGCALEVVARGLMPGRYTFEMGIAASGAPPNWKKVDVVVSDIDGGNDFATPDTWEMCEYPPCPPDINLSEGDLPDDGVNIPGFNLIMGALAALLAWRTKSRRS